MEDYEQLARVTAAECGFDAVHWWQDYEKPQLLRIEAHHQVGKDCITVVFTTLLPEAWLPLITRLVTGAEERE